MNIGLLIEIAIIIKKMYYSQSTPKSKNTFCGHISGIFENFAVKSASLLHFPDFFVF